MIEDDNGTRHFTLAEAKVLIAAGECYSEGGHRDLQEINVMMPGAGAIPKIVCGHCGATYVLERKA